MTLDAKNHSRRWSLWRQVLIAGTSVVVVAFFVSGELVRMQEGRYLEELLKAKSHEVLRLLAGSIQEDLITKDRPKLASIVREAHESDPNLHSIVIEGPKGRVLASWNASGPPTRESPLKLGRDIVLEGERFGRLDITWNRDAIAARLDEHVRDMRLMVSAILVCLAAVLVVLIRQLVIRPILRINGRLLSIAGGDEDPGFSLGAAKELVRLNDTVDTLLAVMGERDRQHELASEARLDADRSERQSMEMQAVNAELARIATFKDQFLANMSHELRTPLNTILGQIEALLEGTYGDVEPDQRDPLESVNESGAHLLALINDILDLARINAGKSTVNLQHLDVRSVVASSLRLVDDRIRSKRQECLVECAPGRHGVSADERHLKQILVNLLGNAAKFTERGIVRLHVRGTDTHVTFEISDTGIGMDAAQRERIFSPFVQADVSTTRRFGGTGLGLAITRALVGMMDGEISVTSAPGQGATFLVVLPREASGPTTADG